jgi:hypothetical protein
MPGTTPVMTGMRPGRHEAFPAKVIAETVIAARFR